MRSGRCGAGQWSERVKRVLTAAFWSYGQLVCRHPAVFILAPVLLFGGLGFGILVLQTETDTETLYFPRGSRAARDRARLHELFPDVNNQTFSPYAQTDYQKFFRMVFQVRNDSDSVFSERVKTDILRVLHRVESLSTPDGSLEDVCARFENKCVVQGREFLFEPFLGLVEAGLVTYPLWNGSDGHLVDLSRSLAGAVTLPAGGGVLRHARVLLVGYSLYRDTHWSDGAVRLLQHQVTTRFTE